MNEEKCLSILETLTSILDSPRWDAEVKSFIDEYCITFVGSDEENRLEHHTVYKDYRILVDEKLQERLNEHGISDADLSYALSTRVLQQMDVEQERLQLLDQLLAVTDFSAFKLICIKRNITLESEAIGDKSMSHDAENDQEFESMKSKPMRLNFESEEDAFVPNPDPDPDIATKRSPTFHPSPLQTILKPTLNEVDEVQSNSSSFDEQIEKQDQRATEMVQRIESRFQVENEDDDGSINTGKPQIDCGEQLLDSLSQKPRNAVSTNDSNSSGPSQSINAITCGRRGEKYEVRFHFL